MSVKCTKCGCDNRFLHRTAPKGETPANWMCIPCIKQVEPELANNIIEDCINDPLFSILDGLGN